jgi:hypothetical protein
MENIGGQAKIENNWMNTQSGSAAVTGSGLVIRASGTGPGCKISDLNVQNNTIEHAGGNRTTHDIDVAGDDSGSLVCQVNFSDNYVERTHRTPAPAIGVRIRDCLNCTFRNSSPQGTGTGEDFINISQSAPGRTAAFKLENTGISTPGGGPPYANTLNDTIDSIRYNSKSYPFIALWIQPGTSLYANGNLLPTVVARSGAVPICSESSIPATSVCSIVQCPAGRYRVEIYIEITAACRSGGTYVPWLSYTDEAGAKKGSPTTTYFAVAGGLGVTPATSNAGASLALTSTSNFLTGTYVLSTIGVASDGLGSINYGTTARACRSGGPMHGVMFFDVTRLE